MSFAVWKPNHFTVNGEPWLDNFGPLFSIVAAKYVLTRFDELITTLGSIRSVFKMIWFHRSVKYHIKKLLKNLTLCSVWSRFVLAIWHVYIVGASVHIWLVGQVSAAIHKNTALSHQFDTVWSGYHGKILIRVWLVPNIYLKTAFKNINYARLIIEISNSQSSAWKKTKKFILILLKIENPCSCQINIFCLITVLQRVFVQCMLCHSLKTTWRLP